MNKETKYILSYETGIAVAKKVIELISPACYRAEIAGSLRRKCATVHDIDIIIYPIYRADYSPEILKNILENYEKITEEPKMIRFRIDGIMTELRLCEPDGSNFEALWQKHTGSYEHNRSLAACAISQNLIYRAGYGIFRKNERIDNGTEAGIYKALGLDYPEPESRM